MAMTAGPGAGEWEAGWILKGLGRRTGVGDGMGPRAMTCTDAVNSVPHRLLGSDARYTSHHVTQPGLLCKVIPKSVGIFLLATCSSLFTIFRRARC